MQRACFDTARAAVGDGTQGPGITRGVSFAPGTAPAADAVGTSCAPPLLMRIYKPVKMPAAHTRIASAGSIASSVGSPSSAYWDSKRFAAAAGGGMNNHRPFAAAAVAGKAPRHGTALRMPSPIAASRPSAPAAPAAPSATPPQPDGPPVSTPLRGSPQREPAAFHQPVVAPPRAAPVPAPAPAQPFAFQRATIPPDWRRVHGLDVTRAIREQDLESVRELLPHLLEVDTQAPGTPLHPRNYQQMVQVMQLALSLLIQFEQHDTELMALYERASDARLVWETRARDYLHTAENYLGEARKPGGVGAARLRMLQDQVASAQETESLADAARSAANQQVEAAEARVVNFRYYPGRTRVDFALLHSVDVDAVRHSGDASRLQGVKHHVASMDVTELAPEAVQNVHWRQMMLLAQCCLQHQHHLQTDAGRRAGAARAKLATREQEQSHLETAVEEMRRRLLTWQASAQQWAPSPAPGPLPDDAGHQAWIRQGGRHQEAAKMQGFETVIAKRRQLQALRDRIQDERPWAGAAGNSNPSGGAGRELIAATERLWMVNVFSRQLNAAKGRIQRYYVEKARQRSKYLVDREAGSSYRRMRRNKHKAVRRTVRFFKINYAFRAPFKVLVDGNFISAAEQLKMGCVQELVVKLLGATCKLYTSPCILSELRRVSKAGGAVGDVLAAAKRTWRHGCGHEKKLSASDCILAQIGGANADHWFVATQDAELRSLLAQKGRIPLLYLSATGLHLEKPSEMAQAQASQKASGAMALTEHELRSAPLQDLDELKKQQRAGEMSKFRRKRAKGPNPLSVKRKQLKKPASTGAPHAAASEAVASRKKRPRRRSAPALGSGSDLDAAPAPSAAR